MAMDKEDILMVIAPSKFRDEELFETKEVLENNGYSTRIASTMKEEAMGMLGGTITPELSFDEVDVDQYVAVVLVGGMGVEENGLYENQNLIDMVNLAGAMNLVIGAICIAPRILAAAELLENGKKVTCYNDEKTKDMVKEAGGEYTGNPVEVDGRIVTADGPGSAKEFGEKLVEVLGG